MLWLPKWLRDETPPPVEAGVSRRTFIFLGASAAVGAMLPTTGLGTWDDTAPSLLRTIRLPVRLGRNEDGDLLGVGRDLFGVGLSTTNLLPSPYRARWAYIDVTEAEHRWMLTSDAPLKDFVERKIRKQYLQHDC